MITTPYEIARQAGIQWGFGSTRGPPLSGSPKFFAVWSESQDIDLSILIYIPQVPFDPSYSFTGFEARFVHTADGSRFSKRSIPQRACNSYCSLFGSV